MSTGSGESERPARAPGSLFDSARWYDLGVNWEARLKRELPVFREVFGPPGELGLLDVACGTGRHLAALVQAGYRLTGLDYSADMLGLARARLEAVGVQAALVQASFDAIPPGVGPFDGVYCIGNSLAAAGDTHTAEQAVRALAGGLRPGGRMFIQILNFERLRKERPAVRGPRARREGGVEYVTTRVFSFAGESAQVTSLTLWNDGGWRQHAAAATLCPIFAPVLTRWHESSGLHIDALWGSYVREPFDPATSEDLIVVATKAA